MTTSSMAMSLATTALSEARQEIERLRAELVGMTASYQQASDESSGHYQEANQLSEQLATQKARADAAERALAIIAKRATDYACENLPAGPACRFGDEIARIATDAQPVAADVVQVPALPAPCCEVRDEKYNRVQFYRPTGSATGRYHQPGTKLVALDEVEQVYNELRALLATRQEGSKV